uniref:Uncharacterized protein n=1 Tax=candidate division CPR3 bacterium TaxID=2268181 RepID=A0A7C5UST1_UNCC3
MNSFEYLRKIKNKKFKAQALVAVLLISTICLIIVSSLAFRSVKRLIKGRETREYQVAFGNANSGIQNALSLIRRGEGIENCLSPNYCGDNNTYIYTIQTVSEEFIEIPKDRSVVIRVPEGTNPSSIELYCKPPGGDAGIVASLIYENSSSQYQYKVEKYALKCNIYGDLWEFGGNCEYQGGETVCHREEDNINLLPDWRLKAVLVKAFSTFSQSILVKSVIKDQNGNPIASTTGYVVQATGYGGDGVSSTVMITLSPAQLPYCFEYALFSGGD